MTEKPRVLFIMCHGDLNQGNTNFIFEKQKSPWLMDCLDEKRIHEIVSRKKIEIGVIVLSTCHSCRLAEILRDCGAPAVIAISTTDQVLQ